MVSSCNVFQIGDQDHLGQLLKISKLIARSWSFAALNTTLLWCWEIEIELYWASFRFAVFLNWFPQEETEAQECPHSHCRAGTWVLALPVVAWPSIVLGGTPQLKSTLNPTHFGVQPGIQILHRIPEGSLDFPLHEFVFCGLCYQQPLFSVAGSSEF